MGSLFVVSDVHGYRDDLRHVLVEAGLLDADGDWRGHEDDALWVLGDLTDRGPDGIGVIDLVMGLQRQAPGQVHVLMGNHEILALGRHRFPGSRFADSWRINGGRRRDQEALTPEHVEWLASLPLMGRAGDFLLVHSDTTEYLARGESVDEVNATVREQLAADDLDGHWDVGAADHALPLHRGAGRRRRRGGARDVRGRGRCTGTASSGRCSASPPTRSPTRSCTRTGGCSRSTGAGTTAVRCSSYAWTELEAARRAAGRQTRRRTAVTLPRMVASVPSIGSYCSLREQPDLAVLALEGLHGRLRRRAWRRRSRRSRRWAAGARPRSRRCRSRRRPWSRRPPRAGTGCPHRPGSWAAGRPPRRAPRRGSGRRPRSGRPSARRWPAACVAHPGLVDHGFGGVALAGGEHLERAGTVRVALEVALLLERAQLVRHGGGAGESRRARRSRACSAGSRGSRSSRGSPRGRAAGAESGQWSPADRREAPRPSACPCLLPLPCPLHRGRLGTR